MANKPQLAAPPATFRSAVWRHFGFPIEATEDGGRVVTRTQVICRLCSMKLSVGKNGNTSNMLAHMRRYHAGTELTQPGGAVKPERQPNIHEAFKLKLGPNSERAKEITNAIGVFMALDMRPFSVVENHGFKQLVNVLEHRYDMPSRPHFSQKVLPKLYEDVRDKLRGDLSSAEFIALTTDSWTSRATESFITITAHYITDTWIIKNPVLQTRVVYDSHTSENLSEILLSAVAEWKLERPNVAIPVTTDNARNIVNAVEQCGFSSSVRCFAHTVNLASQKAMGINQVSRILGRVRKVVSFFHRSTTAAAVLREKQEMLQLPTHKLIQDVPTRWNSSHDMLERYLEKQAAVFSALIDKRVKRKINDVVTLSEEDVKTAEDIAEVMKTLKTVTTLMSTEQLPTVSMIMPLKHTILASMAQSDSDSTVVRNVKSAITTDFKKRYPDTDSTLVHFLHVSTALDPRFKSLPFLDETTRGQIFNSLTEDITAGTPLKDQASGAETVKEEVETASSSSGPPAKRAAISQLFGSLFPSPEPATAKTWCQVVEEEVQLYKVKSSGVKPTHMVEGQCQPVSPFSYVG